MNTKQPSPKLAPIRPLQPHSPIVYDRPVNLPHPHPAPKPGQGQDQGWGSREPTVEEWAEFGKSLYHLRLDLIALKMATVEKHREIDNLFNSVRTRRDPSTIEPCGLCGLSHLGNCNA
jgi:hypothetical protein